MKTLHLLGGKNVLTEGAQYRDDIRGLMRTFSLYARMSKEYWDKIRVAERFDDEGNKAFKELSAIYKERYFT